MLKIGIHSGAAIAVTSNEQLDYFGQTANIASRVQSLADAGEICLSQNVYDVADVRAELGNDLLPEMVGLKGVSDGCSSTAVSKSAGPKPLPGDAAAGAEIAGSAWAVASALDV